MGFYCAYSQGGPDTYGYTWKDSNDPNGPSYSWFNNVGTSDGFKVSGLADDNVVGPFNLAKSFQFYWYKVDKFWIGSNGYIAFNNTNNASPFPGTIPATSGGNDFIAGMMSDLNFTGSGNTGEVWVSLLQDSTVVTFKDVPFWAVGTGFTGSNTFQMILDRSDSSIIFNYKTQSGLTSNNDIAIGIENLTGAIGLAHSYDTYPSANYTVKFYYPPVVTYQVSDAGVEWNGNNENKGQFVPMNGSPRLLKGNFSNAGNQNLGSFNATANLVQQGGGSVFTSNLTVPALNPGEDTTLVFPNMYTLSAAGTYSYNLNITPPPGDATPSNNSKTQELIAIDTNQAVIDLAYADNTAEGSLSWSGGDGGVGMYFEPPTYPAKLLYSNFFITANTNNNGFYAIIYDDDGPDNSPGTLLDSVFVPGTAITLNSYTQVSLGNTVVVNDGGVYLRWEMGGENINIGTDSDAPISRHAYEILGNTWAAYRQFDTEDFMMSISYELDIPLDMAVTSVLSPPNGSSINQPTTVIARVKNTGQGSLSTFPIEYEINGNVVQETYNGMLLGPGDSSTYSFQERLQPPATGTLCVRAALPSDVDISNDESCNEIYAVGLDEHESIIDLYPNPAQETLYLNYTGEVKIFDNLGKLILSIDHDENKAIDIANLNKGVYHILTEDGLKRSFIKE